MNELQYERERLALGDAIRTLRRKQETTGVSLAKKINVSQSKLSKIETGILMPATEELVRILDILEASKNEKRRILDWAQSLRTEFVSWRFGHRKGFAAKQLEVGKLERQAKKIRVFHVTAVPGLLQIPDYALEIMRLANVTQQPDLRQAVAMRIQRQQILYESGREFEFVMMEPAVLSRFCDLHIVIRQLNRLRFLFDLPNARIGFVPDRAQLPRMPLHGFVIYDSSAVVLETMHGEVSTNDEWAIKEYSTAFAQFASVALVGEDANTFLDECKRRLECIGAKWERETEFART